MNITIIKNFIDSIPKDLKIILERFNNYGFDIRIVGGAVRDLLMNKEPRDIDIATDATPDEILFILNRMKNDYNFVSIDAGGIEHGTIKVLTGDNNLYEITSLAYKIHDRNQYIKVTQHRDWKIDALRRDFTFNALSLDMDGKIYDYLGGVEDLKNQRIRFIGFYKIRIILDPIIIFRFAKTLTKFDNPKYNPSILAFIASHKNLIDQINPEAIKWFIAEIRNGEYPGSATPVLRLLKIPPKII